MPPPFLRPPSSGTGCIKHKKGARPPAPPFPAKPHLSAAGGGGGGGVVCAAAFWIQAALAARLETPSSSAPANFAGFTKLSPLTFFVWLWPVKNGISLQQHITPARPRAAKILHIRKISAGPCRAAERPAGTRQFVSAAALLRVSIILLQTQSTIPSSSRCGIALHQYYQ